MYQYRQIIFRLRQGESLPNIAQSKLADRKKVRQIRDIAIAYGWLNLELILPTDEELQQVFKTSHHKSVSNQPKAGGVI